MKLTRDELKLLIPQVKAGLEMDSGDPQHAPPNAVKLWKSILKKLKGMQK